jgi:hypothetical protein
MDEQEMTVAGLSTQIAVLCERIAGYERARLEIKDIYERQAAFDREQAKDWRDGANEWRLAMKDRESEFQTQLQARAEKERLEASHEALTARVEVVEKRHVAETGGASAMTRLWLGIVGVVSLAAIIIAAIFHFVPAK